MVATLSKLTDAGAAAQYYEAGDDYYTQGGKAPSHWHGRGAEALGLDGEVAPDTFTAMLGGTLPDRTVLGTTRHGVREHKPGWDLTRQGRQELTDAIRAALVTDGTLGKDAMVATVLESRDLIHAEARLATSYRPGDIVVFRKAERGRPRAGVGHRVEAVDPATGTVRLRPDKRPRQRAESKPVDWQPARWGADVAEAFVEVPQEFRTGDRVQFTRNNYRADRLNGQTAEVVAIDPTGSSMVLQRDNGRREMLDMRHLADRHLRPGWVRTIHSAQGATCDRVFAHLEAFRANTVDARSVYVAISRARHGAAVYTDNRASLTEALGIRDGAQVGAIDETMKAPGVATATPATVEVVGIAIG